MSDRDNVRDLIRPLVIATEAMNGTEEIVETMSRVPDLPDNLWDLTPEGTLVLQVFG